MERAYEGNTRSTWWAQSACRPRSSRGRRGTSTSSCRCSGTAARRRLEAPRPCRHPSRRRLPHRLPSPLHRARRRFPLRCPGLHPGPSPSRGRASPRRIAAGSHRGRNSRRLRTGDSRPPREQRREGRWLPRAGGRAVGTSACVRGTLRAPDARRVQPARAFFLRLARNAPCRWREDVLLASIPRLPASPHPFSHVVDGVLPRRHRSRGRSVPRQWLPRRRCHHSLRGRARAPVSVAPYRHG